MRVAGGLPKPLPPHHPHEDARARPGVPIGHAGAVGWKRRRRADARGARRLHHRPGLAAAGRRLAPNAERYLKPPADMVDLFRDHPEAVARTRELGDRLHYTMANLGYRFPDYPVPPGETQMSFLRQITEIGARERY